MVIRPMITYTAVVWWPRVNYTTVEKQLEHVQRLACLYITGTVRTTPTIALQMIIGCVYKTGSNALMLPAASQLAVGFTCL